ncbi:endonuclease [Salinimicrobium marinum]|uniref:Endonuclease n=1 Tax=Salinimicrobium marinum TaxID=680283 RepID=A0A918VWH9_9FLAO|nr:endonuclease/exonuclease/phosphatase family protein [Salinimicrobium marinum]GHA31418.1 endonuclease [Salinimicrobium marinum]
MIHLIIIRIVACLIVISLNAQNEKNGGFSTFDDKRQNEEQGEVSLRIMAYNIHHANPPSEPKIIDLKAIIRTIKAQDPDVLALQEVDANTTRSGAGNQAEIIANELGMEVYFGKAINYDGGVYGVAVLSKYSISEARVHALPTAPGTNGEPRVLATVKISLPDDKSFRFGSTHLDSQRDDTNRLLQIQEIVNIASQEPLPMIVAGDFNATPNTEVINHLDQFFTRTCNDCEPTIPVLKPEKAIDFIAFKPKENFSIEYHKVINETYASDHLPVMAVLKLNQK